MYNADLWKQSGHWAFYKDDMVGYLLFGDWVCANQSLLVCL